MTSRRRPSLARRVAARAVALALLLAADSRAGSIGFRIDSEVTSGPGIDAKITLTHTGDEAAADVRVVAEFLDARIEGEEVPRIQPGGGHSWQLRLSDASPPGVYALVIRAMYADANGYPFEIVSTAPSNLSAKPRPRMSGTLQTPKMEPGGTARARLSVKKPATRAGKYEARLYGPGGLEITPSRASLEFDASGDAVAEFTLHNRKLLPGTSVNVYALVSGPEETPPQTDTIRGTVRIGAAIPRVTAETFYGAAAVVAILLLFLEIVARRRHHE